MMFNLPDLNPRPEPKALLCSVCGNVLSWSEVRVLGAGIGGGWFCVNCRAFHKPKP